MGIVHGQILDSDGSALDVDASAVAKNGLATTPLAVHLAPNAPNPFNPRTTIRFETPSADDVSLRVYDVSGRLVRTLVHGELAAVDGTPLGGTRTERRYRLASDGLHVLDVLEAQGALARVRYRVPAEAVDVVVDRCSEPGGVLVEREGVRWLSIAYRLP